MMTSVVTNISSLLIALWALNAPVALSASSPEGKNSENAEVHAQRLEQIEAMTWKAIEASEKVQMRLAAACTATDSSAGGGYGNGGIFEVCKKEIAAQIVSTTISAFNELLSGLAIDPKCFQGIMSCIGTAVGAVVELWGDGTCPSMAAIVDKVIDLLQNCAASVGASCANSIFDKFPPAKLFEFFASRLKDLANLCEVLLNCKNKAINGWGSGNCDVPFNSCVASSLGPYGNNCTFDAYQNCMQCCAAGSGGMTNVQGCKCSCAFYFGKGKCTVGGARSYFDSECAATPAIQPSASPSAAPAITPALPTQQ